jgi:hypothetical protein
VQVIPASVHGLPAEAGIASDTENKIDKFMSPSQHFLSGQALYELHGVPRLLLP